jgi:hypothetical protein
LPTLPTPKLEAGCSQILVNFMSNFMMPHSSTMWEKDLTIWMTPISFWFWLTSNYTTLKLNLDIPFFLFSKITPFSSQLNPFLLTEICIHVHTGYTHVMICTFTIGQKIECFNCHNFKCSCILCVYVRERERHMYIKFKFRISVIIQVWFGALTSCSRFLS